MACCSRGEESCAQPVNDGQLQRIEILHHIHLYPGIATELLSAILRQAVVGQEEQILEVDHLVFELVTFILPGDPHLLKGAEDDLLHTVVVTVALGSFAIEVGIAVNVEHGPCIKRHPLHLADFPDGSDVIAIDALRMQPKGSRMAGCELIHEMRKMDHLVVGMPTRGIGSYLHLVLILQTGQDADCIILVDDGRFGRNDGILKQELRTEAMHIAHIYFLHITVPDEATDPFGHAAGGTIGERQAQHLTVGDPILDMSLPDSLGQDLCLAASRRCKNQMKACLCADHSPLALVGFPVIIHTPQFIKKTINFQLLTPILSDVSP